MAQEFSHPARGEMPEISSPDPFSMEAFHELAKDGFNAVAHVGQEARIGLFLVFGRLVGSQKIQPIGLQALRKVRFPVIAVCQDKARHPLQYFFYTFGVGQMGGSQGTIHKNTSPCQANMSPHPILNMASHFIVAISCHVSKRATVRCSSKTTNRDRKAIDDRQIGIVWNTVRYPLPQVLFHLPQIGCLSIESCARDLTDPR